jgi:mono/diheme cytochrome c family protein
MRELASDAISRMMPRLLLALLTASLACNARSLHREDVPAVTLAFEGEGDERKLSLRELARDARPTVVESDDPFYGARKRFKAIPVEPVLSRGFARSAAELKPRSFVLMASDGYAVPISGARLFEGGAYLAFDDVDVPGFAPIGPNKVSPAPLYLIWTRPGQGDPTQHPRPWQLVSIRLTSLDALYPHAVPSGESADSPAMRGFALFRDHCIKCHAINREGGRVGPDLNVPQSIVEYRPEPQIRAYIRDPAQFRYGLMPAHPDLTDADLDALIAYFGAMSKRKHDRDAKGAP